MWKIDMTQKEQIKAESADFEAEWKRYTASRKDDMQTNAVTMNVKEAALYFAKWGRKQVLTAKPSEELEEEIHRYFKELEKSDCVSNTRRLAKHFAEWQKEQIIGIIEKRVSEILGDAQPAPVLRMELDDIIKRIREDAK